MKHAALLSVLFFILSSSSVNAGINNKVNIESDSRSGDTGVRVNINNQMGTGQTSTSVKSQNSIRIHQSGEGTSKVKINGEEYELVGPGDLEVNDSFDNSTSEVEQNSTTDPTITEAPNPEEEDGQEILGASEVSISSSGVIELVVNTCIKIFRNLTSFF